MAEVKTAEADEKVSIIVNSILEQVDDREELVKLLLEIREIRLDVKRFYNARIFALNPMVGEYPEKVSKWRKEVLRMTKKINLIDDVINFINGK